MPDPVEREKNIETIDDMTLMTEDTLNWTKNISGIEEVQAVELNALISSVANDFSDQGENIVMENFESIIIHIRRVAIKRALTNIISNALKYGKRAHISVEKQIDYIDIHIDDEDPGIAEDLIEEALKPFVRLEKSRNKKREEQA